MTEGVNIVVYNNANTCFKLSLFFDKKNKYLCKEAQTVIILEKHLGIENINDKLQKRKNSPKKESIVAQCNKWLE